jgi:hypothetical protein
MNYNDVFFRLWNDYSKQNPSVSNIHNLFEQAGETIQNDHIAFRTFNDPRLDLNLLSGIFRENGYIEKGVYFFREKHLFAKHFEHTSDEKAPRVFISQLILEDFSPYLRNIIQEKISHIPVKDLTSNELIFNGSIFGKPSFQVYKNLLEESEYAAWVYVFGFRANHFTISINALKIINSIEKVNVFLKQNGVLLNSAGGEIKGTEEELLKQSSTMADLVKTEFLEGVFEIPSCYYEFAQRFPDQNGKLFSGFIAKSADKIFESTNFYKK